jgi:GrpB-like predicted nucleotidyltransferase (UPF0157 family)
MGAPVVLVDYDLAWPAAADAERATVLAAAGDWLVAVEHVGSTAVPGMVAKPVIDLLVGLRRLADADEAVPALEAAGYVYVPGWESIMPFRRFLYREAGGARAAHLHAVERTHAFWDDHVRFRDALRTSAQTAAAYAELKRRLAVEHGHDREAYTDAKTDFVQRVLASS